MTILLAEDDPITLESLATCLEKEGFATLQAADGRQAINLWRDHQPDLVCLDIMMPELSGYDVCRRIRSSDREIPILFLSAKNQEIDIVAGLDIGADDFIRKPFTRREVMARIRANLRRTQPSSCEESFRLHDLTVFPDKLFAKSEKTAPSSSPLAKSKCCNSSPKTKANRSAETSFSTLAGAKTTSPTPAPSTNTSQPSARKSKSIPQNRPSSRPCGASGYRSQLEQQTLC